MKISKQQAQLSKLLRKGARTTVIVTYDSESVTPYYKVSFQQAEGFFVITLNRSNLLRLNTINFRTKEVIFLIFKDDVPELLEANELLLTK